MQARNTHHHAGRANSQNLARVDPQPRHHYSATAYHAWARAQPDRNLGDPNTSASMPTIFVTEDLRAPILT